MKVILVLALALAVANAAFTGSLVQQTKPLLQKAQQNMQVAVARNTRARSSVEAVFQTKFIQAIIDHAQGLIEQITAIVSAGQSAGTELVAAVQDLIPQLQELAGSFSGAAQTIVQNLVNGLIQQIQSIISGKRRSSIDITPQMAGILQMLLGNPTFLGLLRSEPMYLCLKAKNVPLTFEHLQELNAQGELGIQLLNRPEVSECLTEVGGIELVIGQSQTIKFLQALADKLGLKPLIHQVMNELLGAELTQQVIALMNSRMRGFWDSLGNLWGGIVGTITEGFSSFADYVSNLATQVWDSAAAQFDQAQTMVNLFIDQGVDAIQALGSAGAQALVDYITPLAQDLGASYDMIISQITAIYDGIVIPGIGKKF